MELTAMPFLAHARSRASFMRKVAHWYPAETSEYKLIDRAAAETEELFDGEFRFTGEPYFTHSFAVALIAMERVCARNPNVITACVIHDNREHVQELLEFGTCPDHFRHWNESVEDHYGYEVEKLLMAVTAPRVFSGRSSRQAHHLYHRRLEFDAGWREFFEVKLSDRLHNQRTLDRKMGYERIRDKITETKRHYLPHAKHHSILVPELTNALAWGQTLFPKEFA